MRFKTAAVLCIVGLVQVMPAAAKPAAPRSVTYEYSGPNTFEGPAETANAMFGIFELASPEPGERFVTVEIADSAGRPVLAEAHQGKRVLGEAFCGTSESLRIQTRRSIHVHLFVGQGCDDLTTPTQGTITMTFTR